MLHSDGAARDFDHADRGPWRHLHRLARWPIGRHGRWIAVVLWLAIAVVATPLAGRLGAAQTNDAAAFLPPGAESTRVLVAQRQLPSGDAIPAIVVFTRANGPLTAADDRAIATTADRIARFAAGPVSPVVSAPDGTAALLIIPLAQSADADEFADRISQLRATVRGAAPPGLATSVTGPAGIIVDTYTLFRGVEGPLLVATAGVVALILLVVYRGPFLWLVPLLAVGAADQAATAIIYLLARHGDLTVNGQSAGILRVLVFGAGTDYALLLIARYREELTRHAAPADAMRVAVRHAGPAILASAGTVVLGLLCLLLGELNSDRGLGPVGAVGIVTAFVTMMTLLPALLVICGRRLFWPRVPHLSPAAAALRIQNAGNAEIIGAWARAGTLIARRPRVIWVATTIALAVLALGATTHERLLRDKDAFRRSSDAVVGEASVAAHFPPGSSAPTFVIGASAAAAQLSGAIVATPGVAGSVANGTGGGLTQFLVVLKDPPDSAAAAATIDRLRANVRTVPGANALVGGTTAVNNDIKQAALRDRRVVIPLVLAVVLVILGLLLRSLVAPLMLIATVVLSFLAALGVSALAFRHLFGFQGTDPTLPLFGFIFLVALGVDYNIFLMTRVREEAIRTEARAGVLRGLAVTGGVITSAGVVLAATFSVLFIFPLVQLAEIGFLVAFGVLLDTLVVRSVLVPALALDLGRAIWWPSRLSAARHPPAERPPEPVLAHQAHPVYPKDAAGPKDTA
jgi:RND superfamily putative drug exporter